jgi:quinol monooxygenase YgiN
VSNGPVVVVIHYQARPGMGPVAERELAALIAEVVAKEPDCASIRVHRDLDDPDRLLLYEVWTSREAYSGPHLETPHILAFRARAQRFVVGPPTITYWRETGVVRR